jgi:DnaJ family protein C protein 27
MSYNLELLEYGRQSNTIKSISNNIQLISVGDSKVGKSCIIKRYCEGRFVQKYITTIGVDYGVKKVTVSGRKIAVNFFDLSGSPDYESIRNPFFEGAQVVMLIFDLENKETFNNLSKWENVMKNNGVNMKEAVIMLIGNKCDGRTKEIDQAEVIAYAKKKGF